MTTLRTLRMLARYTAWADTRLHDALAELTAGQLCAARPGRPQGMNGILAHICAVDQIWKGHLENRPHGFTTRNFDPVPDFDELRRMQQELDRWYVAHADAQNDTALEQVIEFHFVDGGAGAMQRGDMLLHVVNHKTYHRGYLADMLYEIGLKPPTMDLPVFLRDTPPAL